MCAIRNKLAENTPPLQLCYHAEFDPSTSKCVGILGKGTPNWIALAPWNEGGG